MIKVGKQILGVMHSKLLMEKIRKLLNQMMENI
jgi:hypothetical protein